MLLRLIVKRGPCTASSIIRDFTRVVLEAEGSDNQPENSRRVWPTINELKADWGIRGHTDWLREYKSALDVVEDYKAPTGALDEFSTSSR